METGWNSLIQGTFDRFTEGGDASHGTTFWTGESGLLVALVSLALGLGLHARRFTARRSPEDPIKSMDLGQS